MSFALLNDCLLSRVKTIAEAKDAKVIQSIQPSPVDAEAFQSSVSAVWADPTTPLGKKVSLTFEAYSALRLSGLPAEREYIARQALANIARPKGNEVASGRGKIEVNDKYDNPTVLHYLTAHELDHIARFGKTPLWQNSIRPYLQVLFGMHPIVPDSSMSYLQSEFEALGAQWDFLQAIPAEAREQAITDILASNDDQSHKDMIVADLRLASLPREKYIASVKDLHGYSTYHLGTILWKQRSAIIGIVLVAVLLKVVGDCWDPESNSWACR